MDFKTEDRLFSKVASLVKVNSYPGKLISFDSVDGAGNSTQAALLSEYLRKECDLEVVETKEPTEGFVGSQIRRVLRGEEELPHLPLQLLFGADRGHHLFAQLESALKSGKWVITARYALTSVAWSAAHGVPAWVSLAANVYYPWPNLNVVLKLSAEECVRRLEGRDGGKRELFEVQKSLEKNLGALGSMAQKLPNVFLVNGEGTEEEVFERVKELATNIM